MGTGHHPPPPAFGFFFLGLGLTGLFLPPGEVVEGPGDGRGDGGRRSRRVGLGRLRHPEERVVLLDPEVLGVVLGDVAGDPEKN